VFEWDSEKDLINIAKHGVSFDVAQHIFEGPALTWLDDREDYGEVRKISIGMVDETAVLVVVHTDRNDGIRLISARPASRRERRLFYEQI
jgi:uncharacterized DUF497 family protein